MVAKQAITTGAAAPIGIFDSGLGGLTVAREIIRRLPNESLLYFGDTARVPYGPKSPDTVRRYSREVAHYLCEQGVKAIVIACNTATAHALETLRAELDVPVIGVVEPGARAAVAATCARRQDATDRPVGDGHIGVIGTTGTIRSGAYERAIRALKPSVRVTSQACPLFVPLVEEGWIDTEATHLIAAAYLLPLVAAGVDTVVLGCTHYPLLEPLLARHLGEGVRLIDSAAQTAIETARLLEERGLTVPPGTPVRHRFVASDDPLQFLQLGQRFLRGEGGGAIEAVEVLTLG